MACRLGRGPACHKAWSEQFALPGGLEGAPSQPHMLKVRTRIMFAFREPGAAKIREARQDLQMNRVKLRVAIRARRQRISFQ
jgi:hypothetical protein